MKENKELIKKELSLVEEREKEVKERILSASRENQAKVLENLNTSIHGHDEAEVEEMRRKYGVNEVKHGKKDTLFERIITAFINPFTVILILLAVVSFITDVMLAPKGQKDPITVIIIFTMVFISGILKFVEETKSGDAAEKLLEMIKTTTAVERKDKGINEIDLDEVVVGDIVHVSAGDMIPADVRVLKSKDLFISQSSLTGESEPVEKMDHLDADDAESDSITDIGNIAFMGTNVISGSGLCVVVATGEDTIFGSMAQTLDGAEIKTNFEKGVDSVSWVLIRYMLVMVPVVLFINGFTKGDWLEAFLFAISVAVGLTPEMLPMIVTRTLAKSAVSMSKEKTIIKNLNSIQNLGSMDILCTDKTGTLTQDKIVLEYHLDVMGNDDSRVLRHAFLNSHYQTGLKNLIDKAIISSTEEESAEIESLRNLDSNYEKVDEIPFDFERRRMSVVVKDRNEKVQMITKGAMEEMLSICSFVEYDGEVLPLNEELIKNIYGVVNKLNDDGMRVIGVAQKTDPSPVGEFSVKDEADMVLMGYLAFLDPPKETTEAAIAALHEYGVEVKVLTGDNERVTRAIAKKVGLKVDDILLGTDLENMSDEELEVASETTNIFAKLSPQQKARVVTLLRGKGHSVGYMGDGINDAAAMKVSDVGISVDTAVDIAKESADVILLEKDLMVLERGIIEGRKTYANMIKYIKMTASSNFGNMFSVLVASAFLPFLPMASLHLILLNLIYDISCIAIPWDNVDEEFVKKPRAWDAKSISSFMIWVGPTSSVFDITTYLLMFFIIAPQVVGAQFSALTDPAQIAAFIAIFQAGWFIESMWSQTLVIHMIRTAKIPFVESFASFPVWVLTTAGILVATVIPFTSIGAHIGFLPLPGNFFLWLAVTLVAYFALVMVIKKIYIKKYDTWL